MRQVRFFDEARNRDLKYAVIVARQDGKWLMCRHRDRQSWEMPGGHREEGENIHDTAKRELWEETGAVDFQLEPVAAYAVDSEDGTTYGGLFFAEIEERAQVPAGFEIAENRLMEDLPEEMTYPDIQPALMAQVRQWLEEGNFHDHRQDIFEMML